ncbi:MAG: glycerophosphodiester phosphodiesterase [Oscillospiraceae bacterium]|nr:glycerophosphodiester phosphodiesterase [Oscillospiraceae bacterium]MBQ8881271.1 glycerophosphodiester phosphodiesterase [Oscillospiraceae bacterium]
MVVAIAIVVLVILYIFILKGRTGHKDLPALRGWYYAHRGLHSQGVPENSMAAFRAAKDAGYGIELDVHLMQDGTLAVIHDHSLKRTVGVDVNIEDLTLAQLEDYRLEGTGEKIPLFSEVLELYRGEAPLIVELKPTGKNQDALCKAACDMLSDYKGAYCVESFDPRCVAWLRKNRKDIIRGQLTENFFRSNSSLPGVVKFLMKYNFFNVATRPDFIAYRFADRRNISNFLCRKLWGLQGVTWTIRTKEDFDTAVAENWIPIFENFEP